MQYVYVCLLQSKEAKIIFKEGSVLPPSQQLDGDDNKIGSGGNGNVFTFRFRGKRFAVKEVIHVLLLLYI